MASTMLLAMPPDILSLIFRYIYAFDKVELEFDEDGTISTKPCRLLGVCNALRFRIFETCHQGALRLVYTVRTAAALNRLCSETNAGFQVKSICVIILFDLGCPLTREEENGSLHGPTTKPWSEAWRAAFRTFPSQTDLLIFDLAWHSRYPISCMKRIMTNLTFLVKHRTSGQARCRIVGCRTVNDQRFLERLTINVIPGDDRRRVQPERPSSNPSKATRKTVEAKKADADDELGDRFDAERPVILIPLITIEFWKFKSEEELELEREERRRVYARPPLSYEIYRRSLERL